MSDAVSVITVMFDVPSWVGINDRQFGINKNCSISLFTLKEYFAFSSLSFEDFLTFLLELDILSIEVFSS